MNFTIINYDMNKTEKEKWDSVGSWHEAPKVKNGFRQPKTSKHSH